MNQREQQKDIDASAEAAGVICALGQLPRGALLNYEALADIFQCHQETIRRAIESGHLSPPVSLPTGKFWTVGFLLDHIEGRLRAMLEQQEKEALKVARLPI